MRLIIDRFEGDFAVCEGDDCRMQSIPVHELPAGLKAGDVLVKEANSSYRIDREETALRRARIKQLQDDLWE